MRFLLDTNVFIQAKNMYYAFPICPGFWDSLLGHHDAGDLCSIDDVRHEILRGKDDLADWVKPKVPPGFFANTGDQTVRDAYRKIIGWVQGNANYLDEAKADFAAAADGWLIAYALHNDMVVVTYEQPQNTRTKVKIPNVCEEFGVDYKDTFYMLKTLGVQFNWST